jgi:long-subunit fatty acid transport protein
MPNRDFKCQVQDFCQVEDNGAPAPNRYDVVKQQAIIGVPSLAVAYRVHPKLDLGVRASWGIGGVKARNFPWALPNKGENPKAEGDFDVDVSDSFIFSFGAGALFRPTDNIEIGASYTSEKNVENKGTGNASLGPQVNPLGDPQVFIEPNPPGDDVEVVTRCEAVGTISALKSCVNFKLPMLAQLGGRYIFRDGKGGERADVELDLRWENWERASDDEILVNGRDTLLLNTLRPVVSRHGYQDVWSVRLGGSYKIDVGANALSLRGGFAYDTAAAPRSWTRLDKDGRARALFGGGAAYDFGRWRIDAGFAYVAEGQIVVTDVDVGDNPSVAEREQPDPLQPSNEPEAAMYHPINAGTYTSSYLVGSLGITVGF